MIDPMLEPVDRPAPRSRRVPRELGDVAGVTRRQRKPLPLTLLVWLTLLGLWLTLRGFVELVP